MNTANCYPLAKPPANFRPVMTCLSGIPLCRLRSRKLPGRLAGQACPTELPFGSFRVSTMKLEPDGSAIYKLSTGDNAISPQLFAPGFDVAVTAIDENVSLAGYHETDKGGEGDRAGIVEMGHLDHNKNGAQRGIEYGS